jgi:hypothetical protein
MPGNIAPMRGLGAPPRAPADDHGKRVNRSPRSGRARRRSHAEDSRGMIFDFRIGNANRTSHIACLADGRSLWVEARTGIKEAGEFMNTNRGSKGAERSGQKTVATMIREAIERNGFADVKECARAIKVPYDLFNKVVGGHIPKDAQLIDYAKKLNIDHRELILAAYKEKAPEDMKRYFNSVLLLENHNDQVREIIDIMDALTSDQLKELVQVSRLIRASSRGTCRKANALLALYQQMGGELVDHFDSLILMVMRNENLSGLKEFQSAVAEQKPVRTSRRARA